jgi:HAD superfamily hydrolase (TIGR01662 family)
LPATKVKAVLFDLGETLLAFGKVRVTRLFRQGARLSYDYLRSQGQPVGNFEWYCWKNLIRLRIWHWLSHLVRRDLDTLALLKQVGTRKGIKLEPQQWQHLAWLWYEPLSKTAKAEPNIAETLASLKKSGLKLGIVSNTFVNRYCLDKHLEQLGILDYFTVRVYSCEFGFRKPDPRIFKVAADRIGEAYENILFVGDQIRADVKAAARIGMKAVLKVNSAGARKNIPKGTWKINRLAELPSLIERINTDAIAAD